MSDEEWMLIEMTLPTGVSVLLEACVTACGPYLLRRLPISDRARSFGCMQFRTFDKLADYLDTVGRWNWV